MMQKPEHPVGMLAAARERPASVDAPAARRRARPSPPAGRAGDDHVRAFAVDLLVYSPATATTRTGRQPPLIIAVQPTEPSNSAERFDDLQRRRQIELQPAVAAAARTCERRRSFQRLHQIERHAASRFDLRRTRADVGRHFPDIGEQTLDRRACRRRCVISLFALKLLLDLHRTPLSAVRRATLRSLLYRDVSAFESEVTIVACSITSGHLCHVGALVFRATLHNPSKNGKCCLSSHGYRSKSILPLLALVLFILLFPLLLISF